MKDQKIVNKLKLIVILFAVLIVIVAASMFKGGSQEAKLEKKLTTVGSDFYENLYYDHIAANMSEEELIEFFEKYIEIGIKVDLDNLARFDEEKYPSLIEEFVNSETKDECHVRNTKAVIYPIAPFGKEDYTIEAELDCGFDKE